MNMSIEELVDNFQILQDWEERYTYLIALGAQLPAMDDVLKTEAVRVKGCMSQVWMVLSWDDTGRLRFLADSDAQIVRGLIAVLAVIYSGKTAEEVAQVDIGDSFARLGLESHLSPNRRNGFFSMVEAVKAFIARHT